MLNYMMGLQQDLPGKDMRVLNLDGGVEQQAIKSGKYAKSHIRLKKQQQWPHLNVMHKYVKRTTFDQLKFDAFVAWETRTGKVQIGTAV